MAIAKAIGLGQHDHMSAHSFVEINGRLILPFRESYSRELAGLFTEDELQLDGEKFGYFSTVAAQRDRLQLLGFTANQALKDLAEAVDVWHASAHNGTADAPLKDASTILDEFRAFINSTAEMAAFDDPQDVFWQLDSRTILRLAVDLIADGAVSVRYNLDDLLAYELLVPGTPITDKARDERRHRITRDAPLVILTEGSTDSRLLTEAIGVTHPHLVGFIRFMDFGVGAEGSVGSLIKLVHSFIGAGIANRVLAIADNDTAARDALSKLKRGDLPVDYREIHYPNLPLLSRYPTLGPQLAHPVWMDINGSAGSLEMYLGRELLTVDGDLVPVQWTGYVESQKKYQGAISKREKARIQNAFHDKVKAARLDPAIRREQDWSGVEAIVDAILGAFE